MLSVESSSLPILFTAVLRLVDIFILLIRPGFHVNATAHTAEGSGAGIRATESALVECLKHLLSVLHHSVARGDTRVAKALLGNVRLLAVLGHLVSLVEEVLSSLPIFLVKADVCHAKEALELHSHGLELSGDANALSEVILRLLNITLQQVGNRQLAVAERHRLGILTNRRECG